MNQGIPEREACIQIGFLALVTKIPFYVFGRSGSGKSLVTKRLTDSLKKPNILKVGRREQELPKSLKDFDAIVFQNFNPQDPTVKANIQTAIHEREDIPLVLVSDQRPEAALSRIEATDHIVLTLALPESLSPNALCSILLDSTVADDFKIPDELSISQDELKIWNEQIRKVTLSPATLEAIGKVSEICDKHDLYVPIRKWLALTNIVRAIAFFNGRSETRITDTYFLGNPIWGKSIANSTIVNNFGEAIKPVLFKEIPEILEAPYDVNLLQKKVAYLLHRSNNLYDTKMFNDEPCILYNITIAGEQAPLYVPLRYIETDEDFLPYNELHKEEQRVRCNYHGTSSCTISVDSSVKGIGLRSMHRKNIAPGKFEDFAKLPSYILKEDDPGVAQEKQQKLDELKKEAQTQLEQHAKLLFALRDIFQENKNFRSDLFCDIHIFDKIQKDVRSYFDNTSAIANKLKEVLTMFPKK